MVSSCPLYQWKNRENKCKNVRPNYQEAVAIMWTARAQAYDIEGQLQLHGITLCQYPVAFSSLFMLKGGSGFFLIPFLKQNPST